MDLHKNHPACILVVDHTGFEPVFAHLNELKLLSLKLTRSTARRMAQFSYLIYVLMFYKFNTQLKN